MRWFTSDWHIGHKRIIELADRPYDDVDTMTNMMIYRHNLVVSPSDEVWVLGDVALGPILDSLEHVKRFNGHKHLIVGNHDRNFSGGKRSGGMEPVEWGDVYMSVGFESIHLVGLLELSGGDSVWLSHFPYRGDSHDVDRFDDFRPYDDGGILLHGHTHSPKQVSRSPLGSLQIHVGVDAWHRPVSEEEIAQIIKENNK